MDTLGTDLVLLAIDPGKGRIRLETNLRYGLMGSELIRLAAKAGSIFRTTGSSWPSQPQRRLVTFISTTHLAASCRHVGCFARESG
jgi:hypothetical protein